MNSCAAKAVRHQGCVSRSNCAAAHAVDLLIAAGASPYGLRSGVLAQDVGAPRVRPSSVPRRRALHCPGGAAWCVGDNTSGPYDPNGSCPWPGPWARSHGAHLLM
jgi:hypothetical protein